MNHFIPSYIRVPLVFFTIFGLIEYFVDSGDEPAFMKYPMIMLFLLLVFIIIVAIEGIVGALENILYQSLDDAAKARYLAAKNKTPQFTRIKNLYKKLVGSQPIEAEGELILDHNYDGIRELDNSLPPWWLYGFYASIIFGALYLVRYHIFNGENQYDELNNELAQAKIDIEEYKKTAKDLVDFNTVTVLTDASDINSGKNIYNQNCVACHMADGGGGIGPNLTDEHWILGGGIKNIFKTISDGGRAGKGMIAWKNDLKPVEMAQVSSYILKFQGTTPANPKIAEGDVWIDETATQTATPTEVETSIKATDSITGNINN